MFCPVCKAEYRLGFTKCADCGVDLVKNLPVEEAAVDANVPRDSEGLELLWSGVSQAISDRIHDDLEAAQIVNKITETDFGLVPNLAQSVKFVWIDPRDRASSRSILGKILTDFGVTEQEAELNPSDAGRVNPFGLGRRVSSRGTGADDAPFETVSLVEPDAPSEPVPDDVVEDFDQDDATAEAWSGDDHEMAEYLKLCLSGVGIGCVLRQDSAKTHVFVLPANEARAREIVREVVEATPPE